MGDREIGRESRRIGSSAVARTRDKQGMIARARATQEIRKSEEAPRCRQDGPGGHLLPGPGLAPAVASEAGPGCLTQAPGSKVGQNTLPGSAHLRDSWGTGQKEKTLAGLGSSNFISGQSVSYCGAILGAAGRVGGYLGEGVAGWAGE